MSHQYSAILDHFGLQRRILGIVSDNVETLKSTKTQKTFPVTDLIVVRSQASGYWQKSASVFSVFWPRTAHRISVHQKIKSPDYSTHLTQPDLVYLMLRC